ncbi:Methyltransferase domain-containing protein [Devosia crocina]|uniref:Methyltransferase domain-containing protein n=1 Tax=Devosia crocina TaxID=429728 RepID=A0A1I7NS68_9HYPH|nr:class I SAM-dependent methyltransferase [Devosia crocina]SFV37514.1 Methyltransferase domain-containing protein [Devosia crocina]
MSERVSSRIAEAVAGLPLKPHLRVLEIGCGPGVAARLASRQLTRGMILAIDRSQKAIDQACAGSTEELATGRLDFRCVAAEDFTLAPDEQKFDLAFAMRVGALDGRHPELERQALGRIKAALSPEGILIIDGAAPIAAADLPDFS